MKNIQKLIADRKKLIDEMRSITKTAETREDRKMTDAEGARWQELDALVDAMKVEIEREQRMQALDAEGAEEPQDGTPAPEGKEKRKASLGEFLQFAAGKLGEESRVITGMSELVPADGGFLVQTDHSAELFKRTYQMANLGSRCKRVTVSANSNGFTMNAIAETSRVTGARWGGVNGFWLEEAGDKTASHPKFRKMQLRLKKLAALCYATDELLQDATALESIISQAFPEEFAWLLDNAILRGVGGGQPAGVLGNPALVTVAAEPLQPNATVVYENILEMYTRMWAPCRSNAVWFINQDIERQLFTMALAVGFGGVPVYMPANGAAGQPYATLMGRPVVAIEQASTLGTVGDIMFLDLSQYILAEKGGIDKQSSMHVRFLNDETVFRFVMRVDGQPLWNAALTPATGSVNTLSPFVTLAGRP